MLAPSYSDEIGCRSLVASVGVIGPAFQAQRYVDGIFVGTRDGPVELITWAEVVGSGVLRLGSGSFEDIPVVPHVIRVLCSLPTWKATGVMVATHDVFRRERAERRVLTFATRPLNVYAVEMRVADLERTEAVARLFRSVRASDDNPGYVFVIMHSAGMTRYYPFRIQHDVER
jgi:hypothetical protein